MINLMDCSHFHFVFEVNVKVNFSNPLYALPCMCKDLYLEASGSESWPKCQLFVTVYGIFNTSQHQHEL